MKSVVQPQLDFLDVNAPTLSTGVTAPSFRRGSTSNLIELGSGAQTPLHGHPHELDVVQPRLDDHRTLGKQTTL